MFGYDIAHWATFLAAALLLNLSPGPDMAFILGRTLSGGRAHGFAAMAGIWAGSFLHILFAVVGLSALLLTSATVFSIVKYVGAAYLIWLGIKTLKSARSTFGPNQDSTDIGLASTFRTGVLINAFNPKVALFFLAFLPQFVVDGEGAVWAQSMLHGVLVIVVAAIVEPPLILAGSWASGRLSSPRTSLWLNRALGTLFIGFGFGLALNER